MIVIIQFETYSETILFVARIINKLQNIAEKVITLGENKMAAEIFLTIVFMIPLYGFLIWAYSSPEDVLLFGRRWKNREEPEFSPNVMRYIKSAAVFTMIFSPVILITLLIKPDVFGIALMILIFGIVIIGAFVILMADRKSK